MFLIDFRNFALNDVFEGNGIKAAKQIGENFSFLFGEVGIMDETVKRGAWLVEGTDGFGADEAFADKFEGRLEEIVEEPEFILVEIVEESRDRRFIEARAAEEAADMG